MNNLSRIYGKWLTALFILLAAFWFVFLIAMPQFFMVEQSAWKKQGSEEEVTVKLKIDRLYNDLSLIEYFDLPEALEIADELKREKKVTTLNEKMSELKTEIAQLEAVEVKPTKEYTFDNYREISGYHSKIFVKTIVYSLMVTLLAFVVCYPIAYAIAHVFKAKWSALLMLGVVVPYAINELLRVYAWLMILDYKGVINSLLSYVGVTNIHTGDIIPFLEHPSSVFLAMIYAYILFMLFPIYNTIETLDKNQIDASFDLGANTWQTHWQVVIPHAKPGIAVGCIMTFMLSVGSYAVPQIISRGKQEKWFSQLIYDKFYAAFNWNVGSAYAFTLLLVCLAFVFIMMKLFKVGIEDIAK